jgi:hypothetical protein
MTARSEREEIIQSVRRVMGAAPGLTAADLEGINTLLEAGEYGVAVENLCTQLYEYDIQLSTENRRLLAQVGTRLGVASRYWQMLNPDEPVHEFRLVAKPPSPPISADNWRALWHRLVHLQPAKSAKLEGDPPRSILVESYGGTDIAPALLADLERLAGTSLNAEVGDAMDSGTILGDEPLADGMHVAIRMRRDFRITDARRLLAAARAAYCQINPGTSEADAQEAVTSAADAIFALLEQAGILGPTANAALAERQVDGLLPQGQRTQVTTNESRRLPTGLDCFLADDVFALPPEPPLP